MRSMISLLFVFVDLVHMLDTYYTQAERLKRQSSFRVTCLIWESCLSEIARVTASQSIRRLRRALHGLYVNRGIRALQCDGSWCMKNRFGNEQY